MISTVNVPGVSVIELAKKALPKAPEGIVSEIPDEEKEEIKEIKLDENEKEAIEDEYKGIEIPTFLRQGKMS